MKKVSLVIALLLLCLGASVRAGQEWAPEGVDLGGSRVPVPMPEGVVLSDVYPEFVPGLPEGYHLNDAEYDGQPFILLYRDRAGGGQEILMSVVQEQDDPHALTYVEGSYEGSGGQYLYFMLINGSTLHGSLYLFSLADGRMNLVLEEPCSNNMAIFTDAPEDIAGLGWVAWGDWILPVDLADGSSYEGGAANIEELGGMPEIAGSFFSGGIAPGERKYTYLTPRDRGILTLTTVVIDAAGLGPERTVQQDYDCVNRRLVPR